MKDRPALGASCDVDILYLLIVYGSVIVKMLIHVLLGEVKIAFGLDGVKVVLNHNLISNGPEC